MTSYERNKKGILKYQKTNPNYRIYKRIYERKYRENHRLVRNLCSWKSMKKKIGVKVTLEMETNYLLERL